MPNEAGERIKVCKFFFKTVLQVSDGRISRVLVSKYEGLPAPVDKRGKQSSINKTLDGKINEVKAFIAKFPLINRTTHEIKIQIGNI